MSDKDFAALVEAAARMKRECNTPELATKQLQSEGLLDSNGELAAPYKSAV